MFGTFAYIAWRAIEGTISLGLVVAYYQAFQTSLSALQGVLGGLTSLYEDNLFLTYYEQFMALAPKVVAPAQPAPVPRPLSEGIRYEQVDFRYPDTERTALKGISLTIRPGEITALVGPNGSGKTTLVKLLCRLYDPSGGSVTLDGVDLRQFDPIDPAHESQRYLPGLRPLPNERQGEHPVGQRESVSRRPGHRKGGARRPSA